MLAGYSDIPTNNTALIAIPDIGTHEEGKALICRHGISGIPPSNPIDHWNFVNDDDSEISADTTGFSVSRGQNYGEVRLERRAGTYPLEGTYKCSVSVNSINEMVTVYLFWPCESLLLNGLANVFYYLCSYIRIIICFLATSSFKQNYIPDHMHIIRIMHKPTIWHIYIT